MGYPACREEHCSYNKTGPKPKTIDKDVKVFGGACGEEGTEGCVLSFCHDCNKLRCAKYMDPVNSDKCLWCAIPPKSSTRLVKLGWAIKNKNDKRFFWLHVDVDATSSPPKAKYCIMYSSKNDLRKALTTKMDLNKLRW